jgi:hypothetical protein
MDNRRQIGFVSQTVAMLFVSQQIDGQWQTAPGQHSNQILMAKRTDEAVERHERDMPNHRT